MKRKDFIECMKLHKYKKYISNKVNESYEKNDIEISWKIKNFMSKQSQSNIGTVSVKITGENFHIENIQNRLDLEDVIRQAQNATRTAPDFGALGVG